MNSVKRNITAVGVRVEENQHVTYSYHLHCLCWKDWLPPLGPRHEGTPTVPQPHPRQDHSLLSFPLSYRLQEVGCPLCPVASILSLATSWKRIDLGEAQLCEYASGCKSGGLSFWLQFGFKSALHVFRLEPRLQEQDVILRASGRSPGE